MKDRELLEAAARAGRLVYTGANFAEPGEFEEGWGMVAGLDTHARPGFWNPLTDDGDALRLAVGLKIPLQFPDWQDIAKTWGREEDNEGFVEPALHHNGDLGVATRRAIVRAAAAMAIPAPAPREGEGQ